jgi:hypothetical protein
MDFFFHFPHLTNDESSSESADLLWQLFCFSEDTMRTRTARGVSISAVFPQNAGNATHHI